MEFSSRWGNMYRRKSVESPGCVTFSSGRKKVSVFENKFSKTILLHLGKPYLKLFSPKPKSSTVLFLQVHFILNDKCLLLFSPSDDKLLDNRDWKGS